MRISLAFSILSGGGCPLGPIHYLGHHPPPRNDISLAFLPHTALVGHNRPQQGIQMLVC